MGDGENLEGNKPGKKSFWETFPGFLTALAAIITALGTLLTALAATGVLKLPAAAPDPAVTPTIPLMTPSPVVTAGIEPDLITISLINDDCYEVEYYVDDELIGTAPPYSRIDFQTSPGLHSTVLCYTDGTCGETISLNWMKSTTWPISPNSSCQPAAASPTVVDTITITLVNNDCYLYDFYVDDQLIATIAAESKIEFQTSPGLHTTLICFAGTGNCGEPGNPNWIGSTDRRIDRGSECTAPLGDLITISLNNVNCTLQDFYVDNKLYARVDNAETVEFEVLPGQYSVQACKSKTSECGEPVSVDWADSRDFNITCE